MALGLQFPAVIFYDGQGFMVPAGSGIAKPADLNGQTVCVEKGTTHERNLGSGSPLAIERGLNRLWSEGGLMYAPPSD